LTSCFIGLFRGSYRWLSLRKPAMNLSKTLPVARAQANCALDMLAAAAHDKWLAGQKPALKELLEKIVFYKRAISRNTSPALALEAALMAADDCGLTLN